MYNILKILFYYGCLVGWLVGFYSISTIVGNLIVV